MTLTEKILAHHALGLRRPFVAPGDMVCVKVDWTIASELAWNGMDRTYGLLGRPKLHDKDRFFLAVDHTVDPETLASDPRTQKLVKLSQDFAREANVRHFYDSNQTILHTKFYRDLIQPGQIVLGADSHTSSHGGMGAFAIGLGGADITAAMVLGQSWLEVPETIAVDYAGTPPFGIGGKDIILKTLGDLGRNTVAMERSVEYRGEHVRQWSTDMRFTIANMTAEFGGLNGIFEADETVAAWLVARSSDNREALYFRADPDAAYVARYRIDLGKLGPLVARPFSPDNVKPVEEVAGTPIHGCFIGACTTTEEELVLAGLILEQATRGEPARAASKKLLVVPGDLSIQARLREAGLWAHYEKAGFRVGPPGCSMCLGVASEKASPGEVWLSSQNRNYENRMGQGSLANLASAATVAASALSMKISDPRPLLAKVDPARFAAILGRTSRSAVPAVVTVEPRLDVSGAKPKAAHGAAAKTERLVSRVQRFGNHIDTDAIIPGQFCHLSKVEELGEKAFAFVRPEFPARAREGRTFIVAEEGWGSGSSREQAVWALLGAGITAVIAKSYAFIHKRNLVNEGLLYLVVKDPAFYALVKEDDALSIDPASGEVTHQATGQTFRAEAPSPIVEAIRKEKGLVPAITTHGKSVFAHLLS